MTYVVTDRCVDCKFLTCVEVCPSDAFHEAKNIVFINPDSCTDCDACVSECPVDAIFSDVNVPSELSEWVGINAVESVKYPVAAG